MNITIEELKNLLRLLGEISSKPSEDTTGPESRDYLKVTIKELQDKYNEKAREANKLRSAIAAHKKNTSSARASHVDMQLWETLGDKKS